MVNIVGAEHRTCEFLQQIIFFVRGAVRADNTDGLSAFALTNFTEPLRSEINRLTPGGFFELAIGLADERFGQAFRAVGKVKGIAALDAEEVAVDAALVAVVSAHNFHSVIGTAGAQSGLAAVAAMRADGRHVSHFPRAGLVAVGTGSQCADGADVNAHAAFFALEMVLAIGRDYGTDTAILNTERPNVHALAADADAAVAENAARAVKEDHRRPLLLFAVLLDLDVFRFRSAVLESHVLQFALAASVTNGAIERMISKQ